LKTACKSKDIVAYAHLNDRTSNERFNICRDHLSYYEDEICWKVTRYEITPEKLAPKEYGAVPEECHYLIDAGIPKENWTGKKCVASCGRPLTEEDVVVVIDGAKCNAVAGKFAHYVCAEVRGYSNSLEYFHAKKVRE
jgi:hypothetical protein